MIMDYQMRILIVCCVTTILFNSNFAIAQTGIDEDLLRQIVRETVAETQAIQPVTTGNTEPFFSNGAVKSGAFVDFDLMFLKPRLMGDSAGGYNFDPSDRIEVDGNNSFEYSFAPRLTTGYEAESGTGIQFQLFNIEASNTLVYDDIDEDHLGSIYSAVKAHSIDLELTQRGTFGGWGYLASAGARYAKVSRNIRHLSGTREEFWALDDRVKGWGPTVGLQLSRTFNSIGTTFFVAGRTSWIAGSFEGSESEQEVLPTPGPLSFYQEEFDTDFPINELSIGFESSRQTPIGLLTFGARIESQRWIEVGNNLEGDNDGDDDQNFVLNGFGMTIGLHR